MPRAFPASILAALLVMEAFAAAPSAEIQSPWLSKLGPILQLRLTQFLGRSRIVVGATNSASVAPLTALVRLSGGRIVRTLPIINALEVDVPNLAIGTIASSALVQHMSVDRVTVGSLERTGATIGATAVRNDLGYDGSGIGVAVIDSGVGPWLDDLGDAGGGMRIGRFVDFVGGRESAYDDYGHGTHVAGIIAGNGFDSNGARSGVAPAAHLVVLKVLDASGGGHIGDVIAAIDYAVAHKDELNIRVINLSVAAAVDESYTIDPLTLAAQRAVSAGIVVVAAAGNNGRGPQGRTQYGGITAPGNAPWVLTVGASSHMGTVDRSDDTIAAFSSRGPDAIDHAAKPDLVAPGVGIESLSTPASTLYSTMSPYLLPGTASTSYLPYLSLSGTSMATPVVAGTVALMLQANPALRPNEVKAILQFTAQKYSGYDTLTQGAGFLNAKGAVDLARYVASPSTLPYPATTDWSSHIVWG
ncbi:MAG TPA: S8 family peptidase, partial [Vicinamibacterales bacterium]|nr:S8 family peptidase [Vicinamibacterales bacterium]